MDYVSVTEIAREWGVSDRTVRNYCAQGKISGAFLCGKTWNIPSDALKPTFRFKSYRDNSLLDIFRAERLSHLSGGIYHKTQIELTYNSNHIEDSTLTHDQTRYIFETHTLVGEDGPIEVDDVVETANHFQCVDYVIDNALKPLSESMIKRLHLILMSGTSDSRKTWFNVGDYKLYPNEVGGMPTCPPERVGEEVRRLLSSYNSIEHKTLETIVELHARFETIHPFQDGNGRIGRLITFKECLANNIVPFIIDDNHKLYYYRGLQEWTREQGYLLDTCRSCQDIFKSWLDYFRIPY